MSAEPQSPTPPATRRATLLAAIGGAAVFVVVLAYFTWRATRY